MPVCFSNHTKTRRHKEVCENEIGRIIIDCAVNIHKGIGPGLLESVYEVILDNELHKLGLKTERQK